MAANPRMAYFPDTTKVRALTAIPVARVLPWPGEVVARLGQEMTPGQVVARAPEATGYQIFAASETVGVPPEELRDYLLVEEGQTVKRGMPLLRKPGRFGRSKEFKSAIDGIVHLIRHGNLVLQQIPTVIELRAMVRGKVASLVQDRGVVIQVNGTLVEGLWFSGTEAVGPLKVVATEAGEGLVVEQVDQSVRGTVVVAGKLANDEVLQSLEANGAAGIIVGSAPAILCQESKLRDFPLILTDGSRNQGMAEPIFALLQQSQGRETSLVGSAGDQGRPAVVIPLPTEYAGERAPSRPEILERGRLVRVYGRPEGPHVGKVAHVYNRGKVTGAGFLIPGADVVLSNGEIIFVPYTNLDLIV